ncbi:hypothetical protein ACFY6U_51545 [Streptomyces sp. NPDC013157]|uniref:hypothetical protein n=1 Tax=Streptomyces sp. NPDC013157 TaxID=3364861 RepID=UPI0036B6F9A5
MKDTVGGVRPMTLRRRDDGWNGVGAAQTAEVARLAFPMGCLCMRIREVVGPLFADKDFAVLFPQRGQPAWRPPHRLALVSVL